MLFSLFFFFLRKEGHFLFPVMLFIAFTKCSQWMVLVLVKVPFMFQLTVLYLEERHSLIVT